MPAAAPYRRDSSCPQLRQRRFVARSRTMPVLEPGSQFGLQQLAGRRVRQFPHEQDLVGQLPFCEPRPEKRAQLVAARCSTRPEHDEGERPLLPLLMRNGNDRRFGDGMMRDQRVLDAPR